MNIMLVAVVERTREIGVRMALGARKRDIRRQFLTEAALLSLAGGLVGVVLGGAGRARRARRAWTSRPRSRPASWPSGSCSPSGVGLAAGYWPARNASNLAVVDALRDEMSRRRFRVSWVENMAFALVAMRAQKLRSFLTLLGVMAGVATVIMMVSFVVGFNNAITAGLHALRRAPRAVPEVRAALRPRRARPRSSATAAT